ncbi:hypothetical protein Emed_000379 [Eimeria media]
MATRLPLAAGRTASTRGYCCNSQEGHFQCDDVPSNEAGSSSKASHADETDKTRFDVAGAGSGYESLTGRLDITSSVGRSGVMCSSAGTLSDSTLSSTFQESHVDSVSKNLCQLGRLKLDISIKSKDSLEASQSLPAQSTSEDWGNSVGCCDGQCLVCGELGGALVCHECNAHGNGLYNRYRTSYLYAALDSGIRLLTHVGKLFAADGLLRRKCSSTLSATAGAFSKVTGKGSRSPTAAARRRASVSTAKKLRRTKQQKRQNRDDLTKANDHGKGEQVQRQAHRPESSVIEQGREQVGPPQRKHFQDLNQVSNSFWAGVNFMEERALALARHHPVTVWVVWGLLSAGFFCGINCVLWPILAMLFILRQLRILAWETAVRWLSSNIFSSDFEALLIAQKNAGGRSITAGDIKKAVGGTEVLSLMEAQEKLFFSMPWMAVTAFSYTETLTLHGLSTAITKNLLRPREDFASLFDCKEGIEQLENLPLSAFVHPRLLTRVQRVMGRYCWVRQPGFHVSQQVIKLTRKGLDLLRQQRLREQGGVDNDKTIYCEEDNACPDATKGTCSCSSAAECSCLMDESDVIYLMNESLAQPLDPLKPLWQFVLLENVLLPTSVLNGSPTAERIGSAVIFRMHHAVGDGISATRMFLKDFLRATPTVVDSISSSKTGSQMHAREPAEYLPAKQLSAVGDASLQHSHSRCSAADSEETECTLQADVGSPVSLASTSTTWAPSGASLKASADASEMSEKAQHHGNKEAALTGEANGVPPIKPSVPVCTLPDGLLWRVLIALRFVLQLPFYAAAMVLLSRYDGLLDAPRSGSASKTSIARPICLPLQHMKDLKERLVLALKEEQLSRRNNEKQHSGVHESGEELDETEGRQQQQGFLFQKLKSQQHLDTPHTHIPRSKSDTTGDRRGGTASNVDSVKLTLNDLFAACIVGGYHRCAALAEAELQNEQSGVEGSSKPQGRSGWKEDINFVVPVNLRRREEDAKHLRNRFASLIINLPVNSQLGSLERYLLTVSQMLSLGATWVKGRHVIGVATPLCSVLTECYLLLLLCRMRGVHSAMRRTLHSFALPMIMCLERWLYATWPDLLMVFFLRLTRKISVIFSSVIGPALLPYVHASRVGVGVSAFSCGGNVSICVATDETVASLDSLKSSLMHHRLPASYRRAEEKKDAAVLWRDSVAFSCSDAETGAYYIFRRSGMLHENEDLMWQSVFAALDLVISTINPRKLLYLAADGVAPRAKMNQQRARRYRAAKSAAEAAAAEERQRLAEAALTGRTSKSRQSKKGFDSNCISPGTEFMSAFFRHLRFFCEKKLNEDSRWRGLKVLLSGPDVPVFMSVGATTWYASGEGEHKIMAYLRCCKAAGNAEPGTRHCLYGLDADLIMLSLASHEPHFALLREEVVFGRQTTVDAADRLLHISLLREYLAMDLLPPQVAYSNRASNASSHQLGVENVSASSTDGFQEEEEVLLLSRLQEGLPQSRGQLLSSESQSLMQASERERVIDDFVIFCFLAGNDFLPHTLSTDIAEKGLDTMIACYRRFLAEYRFLAAAVTQKTPEDGPWLVGRCGQLNLLNLYIFLKLFVATVEGPQVDSKAADMQWLMQKKGGRTLDEEMELYASCKDPSEAFRARFYKRKLGISVFESAGKAELQRLCRSYLEGLQWVAYYYYRGPDGSGWRWFYPYHYAPFMHDVLNCNIFSVNLSEMDNLKHQPSAQAEPSNASARDLSYLIDRVITLPAGRPYSPFMQLLSILPPQSADLLPIQLRPLLLNPPRELAASFPRDFEIDMEGVKVLERVVEPLLRQLPPEVLQRNGVGKVVLLMRKERDYQRHEGQELCRAGVTERLSALDSIYQSEHFFFVHKIIDKQHDIVVDLLRLLKWVERTNTQEQAEEAEPRRPAFRSSLPFAFADVVDSCVCEEEVRVLPPPFVARLDEARLAKIIQRLGLEREQQPEQGRGTTGAEARQYIELLLSALRGEGTLPDAENLSTLRSLPPTPSLHPFDHELLYPTTPLPEASADAAALTPSFHTKCFASQYGTGVKVFKRESANESVILNVMPFPKDQLQHGNARSLVDLLKPYDVFDELLNASFVLYDFPFVKLATPVAIWLPTFYFPIKQKEAEPQGETVSQPTQQLQVVETEKRRLRMHGVAVANEVEAYNFFEQHTSAAKRQSNTGQDSLPDKKVANSGVKAERVQPVELQLEELARALIRALPGSKQQLQKRAFHPATASTTALVELLPVEDVMMMERLEGGDVSEGSNRGRRHGQSQSPKSSACVHYRYATRSVYRLLPLVSLPSEDLIRRMQQCRSDILEAVEAYAVKKWETGESVICVASSPRHQLIEGVTGVVEDVGDEDSLQLSVRVASWRSEPGNFEEELQEACKAICASSQEPVYSLENAAEALGVTPFAAYCIFSSIFLKEADNLYDCGLQIVLFSEATRQPAYVLGFSLPWPRSTPKGAQLSARCMTHLFTARALQVALQILQTFPSLGAALDEASTKSHNLSTRCHLKADRVFAGVGEPAFLASRLSSMAAQSPSRRAKAVPAEYAVLNAQVLANLKNEVATQRARLPRAESALLTVQKSNCIRAADMLKIQHHIASSVLKLTGIYQNPARLCIFTFSVQLELGQRLAYARFRGSVQQGSRGTACGFAPRSGACRIECQWNQLSGSQRGAAMSVSRGGRVRFAPLMVELMVKKRLELNAKNQKQPHKTHQHAQHQQLVPVLTEAEAQRIFAQLCPEEKLTLFQRQVDYLESLSIEVLLDEPQLGEGHHLLLAANVFPWHQYLCNICIYNSASDGNERIESLQLLSAPASHWMLVSEEKPGGSKHPDAVERQSHQQQSRDAKVQHLSPATGESGRTGSRDEQSTESGHVGKPPAGFVRTPAEERLSVQSSWNASQAQQPVSGSSTQDVASVASQGPASGRLNAKAEALLAALGVRKPGGHVAEQRDQAPLVTMQARSTVEHLHPGRLSAAHSSPLDMLLAPACKTQPTQIQGKFPQGSPATTTEREEQKTRSNWNLSSFTPSPAAQGTCQAEKPAEVQHSRETHVGNTCSPGPYFAEQQVLNTTSVEQCARDTPSQRYLRADLQDSHRPTDGHSGQPSSSQRASRYHQSGPEHAKAASLLAMLGQGGGAQATSAQRNHWEAAKLSSPDPLLFLQASTAHPQQRRSNPSPLRPTAQAHMPVSQGPLASGEQQNASVAGLQAPETQDQQRPVDAASRGNQRSMPPPCGPTTAQLLLKYLQQGHT